MIDVTCDREDDEICKKYYLSNGIWYASCKIAMKLKRSLDEREDQPDFEELPEEFKDYLNDMVEESKAERSSGRDHFSYQKMKEINELRKEQVESETH